MTAPTFVTEAESAWNTTTTPKTSASLSVQAGDVLLDCIADENYTTAENYTTTNSGTAQTWTELRPTLTNNSDSSAQIHYAISSVTASMTVTSTRTAGDAGDWWGKNVLQYRDSDGIGNTANSGSAQSTSITVSADSSIVAIVADWSAGSWGTTRPWISTGGIGTPIEMSYFNSGADYTIGVCRWEGVPAGTYTVGLTGLSGSGFCIQVIEILGTTGGGGSTLDVASTGTGTSTGSLAVSVVLSTSSTGTGQTTGSVALTLSPGALSATGSGTTTGSAALSSTLALSASGTGQTTGSVNVTIGAVTHSLSSTGTGTSTGSLAVSLTQAVSATGTGTSTGTLDVTVIGGSVTHAISATGTGTTSGSAALIGTLSLSSSGTGTSTGSVGVSLVQSVSATGTGTSTGSVAVTLVTGVVLDLSATGTGTTAGAAAITVSLGLSSTGLGQSGGSLTLRLGQALRSTGSGQSAGSLALVLRMPLGATGYGVSRGSAVLSYPTFRFTPPTHEEPIRPGKDMPRSIGYYRLTYAASIVLVGGRFQSIRTPNPDLLVGLVEGTDYFIGGHEYEVTRNVMAQLEADGFSSVPSFGYGMGAYGAGPYGD